jgi:hypothetical protein
MTLDRLKPFSPWSPFKMTDKVSGHALSKKTVFFFIFFHFKVCIFFFLEEKKTTPPLLVASDAAGTPSAAAKDTPPFVKGRYWNYEEDR